MCLVFLSVFGRGLLLCVWGGVFGVVFFCFCCGVVGGVGVVCGGVWGCGAWWGCVCVV